MIPTHKGIECVKACVGTLSIYKKIAKETKKTKQNQIFTVGLCPFLFPDYQKKNVHVFAVTFAFHFADVVIVYSGHFPLFVPVSNATSFLYRQCDAVSRNMKANFVKILSATLQNGYLNVYIFGD